MKNRLLFIISIALFLTNSSHDLFGQISKGGKPKSSRITAQKMKSIDGKAYTYYENQPSEFLLLEKVDNVKALKYAKDLKDNCKECKNDYYSTGIEVDIDLKKDGKKSILTDGTLWTYQIKSEGAYALEFSFDKFILPIGSELYIYSPDQKFILGSFTDQNNHESEKFSTQALPGNSAIIEYFEPKKVDFKGVININRVFHSFKPYITESENRSDEGWEFGISGSCMVDSNCNDASDYQIEKNSAVRISFYDRVFNLKGNCSGSLLNSTNPIQQGYILTAEHCIAEYIVEVFFDVYDSDLIFEFNWESKSCGSTINPELPSTIQGGYLETKGKESDYALYNIGPIPVTYDVTYLGWDARSSISPTSVVSIHHPSGDVKKFSKENNAPSKVKMENTGNNWFEVSGSPQTHWKISEWDIGVTEGGSSGSLLIDANTKKLVGQLSNGTSRCTDSPDGGGSQEIKGPDNYGLLSHSWEHSDIGYPLLKSFLDWNNTGTKILDSYIPNSSPHCSNGILDGDETGVDCGGSCIACEVMCNIATESITLSNNCWSPVSHPIIQTNFNYNCDITFYQIIDENSSKVVFQRSEDQDCYWQNSEWTCIQKSNGSNITIPNRAIDYSWLDDLPEFPDTREFRFFVQKDFDEYKIDYRTFTIDGGIFDFGAGDDVITCLNSSISLGSGNPQFEYEWIAVSPSNAENLLSNTNSSSTNFISSDVGTFVYNLVATDPTSGCQNSDQVTVVVQNIIKGDQEYSTPMGSQIILDFTLPISGLTYTWSPTTYLDNPNSSKPMFTAPAIGTTVNYTVTISDGENCSEDQTATVNVLDNSPTGLISSTKSNHVIHLSWEDNSATETGYLIERKGGGSTEFETRVILPANSTFYDDIVFPNTIYEYRIINIENSLPTTYSSSSQSSSWKALDKRLGGTGVDVLTSALRISDGYVLAGATSSPADGDISIPKVGSGDQDVWLIKTDFNFNKIWDKRYEHSGKVYVPLDGQGENNKDWQRDIKLIKNSSGNIVLGYTDLHTQKGESYCFKEIDPSTGNIILDRSYGTGLNTGHNKFASIENTHDGGYLLGGSSNSMKLLDKTGAGCSSSPCTYLTTWLIKVDQLGNKIWDKSFGYVNGDWLIGMKMTEDGNVILCVRWNYYTRTNGSEIKLAFIKIDQEGNEIWRKEPELSFTISDDESYINPKAWDSDILELSDNSLLFSISSALINLDENGNLMWDRVLYSKHNFTNINNTILDLGFNGILLFTSQQVSSVNSWSNFQYHKINLCGDIEYSSREFGASQSGTDGKTYDYPSKALYENDGSLVMTGFSSSLKRGDVSENPIGDGSYGSYDYWMMKIPVSDFISNVSSPDINENDLIRAENIELNNIVNTTSTLTTEASQSITLKVGFHAEFESTFSASIVALKAPGIATSYESCPPSGGRKVSEGLSDKELEAENDLELILSPNPTNGLFNVNLSLPEESNAVVSLYDLTGNLLLSYKLEKSDRFNERLDISGLAPSIYILTISTNKKEYRRKIIKKK